MTCWRDLQGIVIITHSQPFTSKGKGAANHVIMKKHVMLNSFQHLCQNRFRNKFGMTCWHDLQGIVIITHPQPFTSKGKGDKSSPGPAALQLIREGAAKRRAYIRMPAFYIFLQCTLAGNAPFLCHLSQGKGYCVYHLIRSAPSTPVEPGIELQSVRHWLVTNRFSLTAAASP